MYMGRMVGKLGLKVAAKKAYPNPAVWWKERVNTLRGWGARGSRRPCGCDVGLRSEPPQTGKVRGQLVGTRTRSHFGPQGESFPSRILLGSPGA